MTDYEKQQTLLIQTCKSIEKKKHVHHVSMAVENLEGTFKFNYHSGVRNKEGDVFKQDTPFMIASVTKLFIATTILKLHELNKLDLDDLVCQHLNEDLIEGVHVYKGKSYHKELTIRHLISHTSGILDYIEVKDENKKTIFDRVIEEGDQTFGIPMMCDIVKKKSGAYFPPQKKHLSKKKARYSDTNFQLLRAIIERVTKTSSDEAFKTMIFEPLGMDNTFLPIDKKEKPYTDVATLWVMEKPLNVPLALRSFGDYYSTTRDLFTFMRALFNHKLFKNKATFDLMMHDFTTFSLSFSPVAPAWPIAYSKGLMRFTMPRLFTGFKTMPTLYGHTGVGSAFLFYSPELDLMFTGTVGQVRYTALPFQMLPRLLVKLKKLTN